MPNIKLPDGNSISFEKKINSSYWAISLNKSNQIYRSLWGYGIGL